MRLTRSMRSMTYYPHLLGDLGEQVDDDYNARVQRWGTHTACVDPALPGRKYTQNEANLVTKVKNTAQSKAKTMISTAQTAQGQFQGALDALVNEGFISKVGDYFSMLVSGSEPLPSETINKRDQGAATLRTVSQQHDDLNGDLGFLMYYAPNTGAAQDICSAKQQVQGQLNQILDNIGKLNLAIAAEADTRVKNVTDIVDGLLKFFQSFMAALQALIDLIEAIFKAIASTASFFAQHPYALLIGLGILGVGAAAIYFRKMIPL